MHSSPFEVKLGVRSPLSLLEAGVGSEPSASSVESSVQPVTGRGGPVVSDSALSTGQRSGM